MGRVAGPERGPARLGDRPERRREIYAGQHHRRSPARALGRVALRRCRSHDGGASPGLPPRHRARARRPAPVRADVRGGEPGNRLLPCGGARRACRYAGARLSPVPDPPRAAPPTRRLTLRRPATDGRHRPRAHGPPAPPAPRRAVAGPGPHAIHEEGVAIVLVEQNVVRALDIADHVYVLEEGRVVAEGTPSALRQESRIQEAYLGLGVR